MIIDRKEMLRTSDRFGNLDMQTPARVHSLPIPTFCHSRIKYRVMDSQEPLHREPSFTHFRPLPKRAMASFDNLVALANHQERLREARKMVWRDRGEPAVELDDIWDCLEHAGRGGIRM